MFETFRPHTKLTVKTCYRFGWNIFTRGDLKPERQRSSYHLEILVNVPLTNTFISATWHGHRGIFHATPKKTGGFIEKKPPSLPNSPERIRYSYVLHMYHISGRASRFLVTRMHAISYIRCRRHRFSHECVVFFCVCVINWRENLSKRHERTCLLPVERVKQEYWNSDG